MNAEINDAISCVDATAIVITAGDACDDTPNVLVCIWPTSDAMIPPIPVTVDVGSTVSVGSPDSALVAAAGLLPPDVSTDEAPVVSSDSATTIVLVVETSAPFEVLTMTVSVV